MSQSGNSFAGLVFPEMENPLFGETDLKVVVFSMMLACKLTVLSMTLLFMDQNVYCM